ncbi:antibiotic biosynthesis monooxygenase [Paenarthrobacter sp. A20]|uniref:antibiotic biosynthesis monooxygenase n=1 Tax=Paenarthrobacter sp. A20 TaxID=2817891 RepID=UPI00209E0CA5|nr:antibiotic biosynthesis monooxygenase [Paenarthrobacter sp. A20]MCP1413863.1 quinol monooxygenase YgiN [Paenarthrobacter sp. A20]
MIRTQLHLKTRPGLVQDVLDFYADRGILARSLAQPGCLAAEIRVPLHFQDCVVVSALWESGTAYQSWVENPERDSAAKELIALLDNTEGALGDAEVSVIHDFKAAHPCSITN